LLSEGYASKFLAMVTLQYKNKFIKISARDLLLSRCCLGQTRQNRSVQSILLTILSSSLLPHIPDNSDTHPAGHTRSQQQSKQ
jgi:hypothetical protein